MTFPSFQTLFFPGSGSAQGQLGWSSLVWLGSFLVAQWEQSRLGVFVQGELGGKAAEEAKGEILE